MEPSTKRERRQQLKPSLDLSHGLASLSPSKTTSPWQCWLASNVDIQEEKPIAHWCLFRPYEETGLIYLICSLSTGKSLGWLSQSVPSGLNKHLFLIILDVGSPRSGWLGTWRENIFPVMSSYSLFLVLVCREKEISCLLLFL